MAYDPSEEAERARIKELGRMARAMNLPTRSPRFALPDGWRDWVHGWVEEDNRRRRPRLVKAGRAVHLTQIMSDKRRASLQDERHRLMHEYGQGAYRDGLIRDRIAEIDRLLAEQH